jgi:hypothetical protein
MRTHTACQADRDTGTDHTGTDHTGTRGTPVEVAAQQSRWGETLTRIAKTLMRMAKT